MKPFLRLADPSSRMAVSCQYAQLFLANTEVLGESPHRAIPPRTLYVSIFAAYPATSLHQNRNCHKAILRHLPGDYAITNPAKIQEAPSGNKVPAPGRQKKKGFHLPSVSPRPDTTPAQSRHCRQLWRSLDDKTAQRSG